MIKIHLFLFTLLNAFTFIIGQEGDSCTIRSTGTRGICKIGTDCRSAEEQAKKGVSPTLCGFHLLTEPIVCCENSVGVNDNLLPTNYNINNEGTQYSNARISEQKCDEYSKPVQSVVQVLPLVSEVKPIPIKIPKCDYNSVPLIVGGEPADPGEFPFMVLVGFNATSDPWRCGGTLISDRFVVTAAHCTFSRDAGPPSVVRLGELDISTNNDGSQPKDYLIVRIITHPNYNYPQKYNDIALLKTRERVIFTNFIRPACLNLNKNINSGQGLATGFGKDAFAGEFSNKLMKVTLNFFDNQRCDRVYSTNNKELPRGIVSSMICAGDLAGGKDTCLGDSGGPLVITKKGNMCQFFLVGVTSFGRLCGEPNTPAIYTRVSEYIEWIEKEVW